MTASRAHRAGQQVKAAADATLGLLAVGMLRAIRATSRTAHVRLRRRLHAQARTAAQGARIGRANLAAAFPEKSASRDRDDSARRLGQSRPRRRRIRPYRPPADARTRSARPGRHALHARGLRAVPAPARRRQAGADLRRPSRQLGAAGAGGEQDTGWTPPCSTGGPISARSSDAIIADPQGQHGHAGSDRSRRAAQARCACSRPAATSPCWSTSITSTGST